MKTLSEKEVNYFTDVDFVTSVQLVAELAEENNKMIGGCRYVVCDKNTPPERAEIAFTVFDDFQGKGLGKILFRHLADIGRANGFRRFDAVVLAINRKMMGVFSGSGLKVSQRREGSEVYVDIDLVSQEAG